METIIPSATMRRGELIEWFNVPEAMPDSLDGYPWPAPVARKLKAAQKYADALYEAYESWSEAHEEYEDVAPAADQKALEDAIRAGKADPGTPATEKADRAEHVAWTRLGLALDDARANTVRSVVATYLAEHPDHLASVELQREEAVAEVKEKARQLIAEETGGWKTPSVASVAMRAFTASRWDDNDALALTLVELDGTEDPGHTQRVQRHNAEVLAAWQRAASNEPEPAYDIARSAR